MFIILFYRLIVLISIRLAISKLEKETKKIIFLLSSTPPCSREATLERGKGEGGGGRQNGHCLGGGAKDKESKCPAYPYTDNLSVSSEPV